MPLLRRGRWSHGREDAHLSRGAAVEKHLVGKLRPPPAQAQLQAVQEQRVLLFSPLTRRRALACKGGEASAPERSMSQALLPTPAVRLRRASPPIATAARARAPCLASSPRAGAPCEPLLLGEARSSRLADGATKQMRGGSSKPALPASRGVVGMETMLQSGMAEERGEVCRGATAAARGVTRAGAPLAEFARPTTTWLGPYPRDKALGHQVVLEIDGRRLCSRAATWPRCQKMLSGADHACSQPALAHNAVGRLGLG